MKEALLGGVEILGSVGNDCLGARAQEEIEVEVDDRGVITECEWPSENVGEPSLLV